ncbi:stage II sporulation protein M [Demequina capsici]|uniref:Stage II sporulation protein M n=1 Tax=Demequina capsici TaxID=3075620 RepID=A0AA96J8X9_9MICO|nr:stage II sporulation protein M [Demequina sp. PMTSA13]WNM26712.1 stage II sporulation protein M [Demequina sp. PMTSA13]
MDLDSFMALREDRWRRLQELSRRSRPTGAEADELARLYQLTASDLAQVRSSAPDPALVSRLSVLLARARAAIAGSRAPAHREIARFFALSMPASLYRLRWWTLAMMGAFLVIGTATAVHYITHPELMSDLGTFDERQQYAQEAFATYYSDNPSTSFFARVWTNNSWVAAMCVLGGITGIIPIYVQLQNAVSVGVAASVMHEFGQLGMMFQLILPHGLLELTGVWIAGAAGLRLAWTALVPGPRPRLRALAEEGRSMFGAVLGVVVVLLCSGIIEGYVTGSPILPWWLKILIGVIAVSGYWTMVFTLGRRAALVGETGDVSQELREDIAPVAA